MKTSKKSALLFVALSTSAIALAGCFESKAKIPVNFVAVTSSDWNASVTIGDSGYKFSGRLEDGKNFTLKATTQSHTEPQQGGNQGGQQPGGDQGGQQPGGQGFPGGDQQPGGDQGGQQPGGLPGGEQSSEAQDEEQSSGFPGFPGGGQPNGLFDLGGEESSSEEKKEDLSKYDFTIKGTYELEQGYGYILHFDDENKTNIHVDYNKTEGRHEFYYTVKVPGTDSSSLIKFQAKDPTFAKSLASDYKVWDERDSKYIFCTKATGNNNSVATAYLYLHSDGTIVDNSPSGANRAISYGMTWTEANGVVTIKSGDKTFHSEDSINASRPGKRITVETEERVQRGPNVSVKTVTRTYLWSQNPDVRWKKMTPSDFDGAAKYTFNGSYSTSGPDGAAHNLDLFLTPDGKARIYEGASLFQNAGTWSEDDKVLTLNFPDKDPIVSTVSGGARSLTYSWSEKGDKGDTNYNVTFNEKIAN